ncbi:MAG TPA: 3-hydroxyacyl-CoA dehydrogenase/enoyl-CoA hydratase family protein [Gemmatimonadaceae bacterium]|nr:3-hydroxyacyl-CoA dehydrogenase/enoyl-CoA hydratase family protein [Gemmatimonadaceae bacterium]
MRIRTVGVVGAGTMGSGIAALAASAGIPVVLLDIPGAEGKPSPAAQGLQRALKARPPAFMDPARAALVRTGDIERDLALLAGCDLVIEAIVEQLEPKRQLFDRLEELLAPGAVIASNTSGIPIAQLVQGRGEAFRGRFLGMHFFNPPRYLHLLELIPTGETRPDVLRAAQQFGERVLGKGVVVARDVPGFVANRIGVYGLVQTVKLMERFDLDIGTVDALTGELLGRPKSATFRTADITGLDVLGHVTTGLARATGEDVELPAWVHALVDQGRLGEKSGAGFYRKQGKTIETLDWRGGDYAVREPAVAPEVAALAARPLVERLRGILTLPGRQGDFLRATLFTTYHYALETAPLVAYDLPAVDHALEWGFGWELGPFRQMDALGLDTVREGFREMRLPEPPLLAAARGAFYREAGDSHELLALDGRYVPAPVEPGRLSARRLARLGAVLLERDGARLLDAGDDVALFAVHSKMNTLGESVLRALADAMAYVEREGLAGLVVGNDDPRTFSAGADLTMIARLVQAGDWARLDEAVRIFQEATTSVRRAPFPVVSAPAGLTLGGGAELTLHADHVQAHAELYIGLVEVGVGLLPAGGGTKELLFRFTQALEPYEEADRFEAVKRAFQAIALAKTSGSALDARNLGFLREGDGITMNRDFLLADAKARVLTLAPGYVPPPPRTVTALGRQALGNLEYAVFALREGGYASEHDARIGLEIARVLCGGDAPPHVVSEQEILDLEREAFLRLLGTKETQERIEHMLRTGKPLRN